MRDRASAPLVLQPPSSFSLPPLVLPPQVLWPAQTRGIERGMLQQWMLLFRKIITRETCFLLVAAAVTGVRFYVNTTETYLFLIKQRRTSTLAAALPFVCVLPVEGLVVFSTVGHSVTAGAGFAPGTTTHPAKLHSGDGQNTVVRFRLTRCFILWRKKAKKGEKSKNSHTCNYAVTNKSQSIDWVKIKLCQCLHHLFK